MGEAQQCASFNTPGRLASERESPRGKGRCSRLVNHVLVEDYMRRLLFLVLLAAVGGLLCGLLSAAEPMIKLDLPGRTLEGTPLTWSQKKMWFLGRDGQLNEFAPAEASNYSQIPGGFRSYSQAEI